MHIGGLKEYGSTYGYDLIGGVEWKIPAIPIVISADIKPAYHINHEDWFEFPATVSVHYAIFSGIKNQKKKKIGLKEKSERKEGRGERKEEKSGMNGGEISKTTNLIL